VIYFVVSYGCCKGKTIKWVWLKGEICTDKTYVIVICYILFFKVLYAYIYAYNTQSVSYFYVDFVYVKY
jgi:hypothetical protein